MGLEPEGKAMGSPPCLDRLNDGPRIHRCRVSLLCLTVRGLGVLPP
jgi:hypothetical protein